MNGRILDGLRACGLEDLRFSLLLACSGGADSVAMVHLFHRLREERLPDLRLGVATLDHGLRGAGGEADAEFVRELCLTLGLPCQVGRLEPGALGEMGGSLEEEARRARYGFLERAARAGDFRSVATAHTRDDAAETFLMRALRGAGRTGLRGVARVRPLGGGIRLIRPLLDFSRDELRHFLREAGISWREDATNRDLRFDRNRLRARVIPALEAYSPGAMERLARASHLITSEEEYLRREAAAIAEELITGDPDAEALDRPGYLVLPDPLRYRVLREFLRRSPGGLRRIRKAHLDRMDRMMEDGRGALDLPGQRRVEAGPFGLQSAMKADREGFSSEFCFPFLPPGVIQTPSGYILEGEEAREIPTVEALRRWAPSVALLDAGRIQGPWIVRSWRPGDRIRPLGMKGRSRKVQDLFTDRKIPAQERKGIPILESAGRIAWIGGVAVSEEFRLRPDTREALRMEIRRAPAEAPWLPSSSEG